MKNFVITISRGYGSGGKIIGESLAKQLGVKCYNRELLYMASEESGINEEIFAKNDEKVSSYNFLRPLPKKKPVVGDVIPPDSKYFVSEENLFRYSALIIRKLAERESFVVIGRAADYVLEGHPNLVSVHIHAPHDACVKTVMDMFSVSEKEAKTRIRTKDRERSEYYKYYTGSKWDSPDNYDLILNSEKIGWDNCVKLISDYTKMKIGD